MEPLRSVWRDSLDAVDQLLDVRRRSLAAAEDYHRRHLEADTALTAAAASIPVVGVSGPPLKERITTLKVGLFFCGVFRCVCVCVCVCVCERERENVNAVQMFL